MQVSLQIAVTEKLLWTVRAVECVQADEQGPCVRYKTHKDDAKRSEVSSKRLLGEKCYESRELMLGVHRSRSIEVTV